MKLLKTFGSLTTLSLVVLHHSVSAPIGNAAQLDLGSTVEEEIELETRTAQSDVCSEEPISPEALQKSEGPLSHTLGPNLIANAGTTDTIVGLQSSQTLVAQDIILEDCAIGGIAPTGGLPAAAAGFPLAAALLPAGAAAAVGIPLALTGGDDGPAAPTPNVPEPAETATAGLFACLGIAGIVAKRKMNRSR